ncbi:MAG: thioredoxin-dependent thiol peroxidase [Patescibacteria group bacterium]|nr:thioredoxin-dependent thiol peroxidase [Patescibacteria group bacterium]
MSLLKINSVAPNFALLDDAGKKHELSDYKGRWVLLYFYPKDDTPGCTKEACGLRDVFPDFEKINTVILGVSTDSIESHRKFKEKYKLPFTLLSDFEKNVVKIYGVWQKEKFIGKEYESVARKSFLIDPQGRIVKIYENVDPRSHPKDVFFDLLALQR